MTAIKRGRVVLTVFNAGQVRVDVSATVKELIQLSITQSPLEGAWGSPEHLAALREMKALLDRVIARVEADAG
jgi:hypothetical protein